MINLIIDLNYLFHRTLSVMQNNWANPFQDSESESQFVRKIFIDISYEMKQIKSYNRLIICCDSSSWRKKYNSEYKANREKTIESPIDWNRFYQLIVIVCDILKNAGAVISKLDNAEADDLIYLWTHYFNSINENSIILTADRDLYQCVISNNDSHCILINNNSKTRKIVVSPEFKEIIEKTNNDIFNQNISSDALQDLYKKHEILEIDKIFHVFSKILEGDKGDNVKSIWNWIGTKNDSKKITPSITKKVFIALSENNNKIDLWDIIYNESRWNTFCINLELYSKQKIDRNILKENYINNINLMYLDLSTIPKDIQENFNKQIENLTYISKIDLSILNGTVWEKKIEIKSDIFSNLDNSYLNDELKIIEEKKDIIINKLW